VDFSLTDAQRSLQEGLAAALSRICTIERLRDVTRRADGEATEIRREAAELGIPGLIIDERHGGMGLGLLEAALVAEELGRFAVPTPFAASAVMAPLALALAGSPAQQAALLPKLATSRIVVAVGISEFAAGARDKAGLVLAQGRLSGTALFVVDSAHADVYLLADRDGGLHLVPKDAAGLAMTPLDTIDRTRSAGRLALDGVAAEPLPGATREVLARMRDAGRIVLAADTLGAAWHMLDAAVAYAAQRWQFGRPIGSFQAIKHICAELAAELEPGRALVWYAAFAQDDGRDDASLATAHAKAYLTEVGRLVARRAIEVHGGIGITEELGLHLWFKRIGWNYQVLGAPERLREEAARLQNLVA
jgi:alkylation response protein AidB-like acyl-CoA dehydrogenase